MNFLKDVAEYLTPVLTQSQFLEKGVLTPQEFVQAGEHLVYKFPGWKWQAGEPGRARPYLPPDKQFLSTTVFSVTRANSFETNDSVEQEVDGPESGWLATHADYEDSKAVDVPDIVAVHDSKETPSINGEFKITARDHAAFSKPGEEEDIPDMSTFEDHNLVQETDEASLPGTGFISRVEPEDNIAKTRTYEVSITYDKYYQTPRVWLFGYDEHHTPLTYEQILEDVTKDYANRTVTAEAHPHLSMTHVSIHPCKHSLVMKKIVDNLIANGKTPRVEQYLFLFLKFMSSVIPTIEYDYTVEVDA